MSTTTNLIPLTIPAASLIEALDAVTNAGEPLVGATVRLQLKGGEAGGGGGSSMAHLTVDQPLLDQLNRGENIHVVINPAELVPEPAPPLPPPPPAPQVVQKTPPPAKQEMITAVVDDKGNVQVGHDPINQFVV